MGGEVVRVIRGAQTFKFTRALRRDIMMTALALGLAESLTSISRSSSNSLVLLVCYRAST